MGRAPRPPRPRPAPKPHDPDDVAPNLRNRIVRQDVVAARTLQANPRNWRTHSDLQRRMMRSMLQRIGFVGPVMVSNRTSLLLDGHLRVEIAAEDDSLVPVDYVDLSPEEEATVLAVYDPMGALAGVDAEMQAAVLLSAGREDDELQNMLDLMLAEAEAIGPLFASEGRDSPTDGRAQLGHTASNVKIVVGGLDLPTVERALQSAGTPHRGRALTIISNHWLTSIGLEGAPADVLREIIGQLQRQLDAMPEEATA